MTYSKIDTFYPTEEQVKNSPSREDGIDEITETTLRIYGCQLIQNGGVLLGLSVVVIATARVLFHRFYCKKSFARLNVKMVAASCTWLASKLAETPKESSKVLKVFHGINYKSQNSPIPYLDESSQKFQYLMRDLIRTVRYVLKEMGFVCHVELPYKFVLTYLNTLGAHNQELKQEAFNLVNDSLCTTLCVGFKSHVVACGVVYAAASRFGFPLRENPPWWEAFDVKKSEIFEVCRAMAHLYSLPKAEYIAVRMQGRQDELTGVALGKFEKQ